MAEFIAHLAKTTPEIYPVTVIGMDGFHRYQEDLLKADLKLQILADGSYKKK
ncbi:MAG: hypothetical protein LUC41_03535 [Clostridiales bacterium]|nr:hypothetical protein [Clostridiales bacterium]